MTIHVYMYVWAILISYARVHPPAHLHPKSIKCDISDHLICILYIKIIHFILNTINDIMEDISSILYLFADDAKLSRIIRDANMDQLELQRYR